MHKRKTRLMVCAVLLAAVLLCVGLMAANSLRFRVGRCLMTTDGRCLLLMDNSPVALSDRTVFDAPFADYNTGDVLLVLHDGIQETYPGRTGAYFTLRLQKGEKADVPQEVCRALTELGWMIR